MERLIHTYFNLEEPRHLGKSRKALDDTRKLACFSLCRKTRLPLEVWNSQSMCLGLIWLGFGVTRNGTWSLAYAKQELCHWAVPPTLFCSVFVLRDRICRSQAVLELACGCLALNRRSSIFHVRILGWPMYLSRQFKQSFAHGGNVLSHAQSKICAFS